MTNPLITLDPARWHGGPLICPIENRPALPTLSDLNKFLEQSCPSVHVEHKGKCGHCGYWHSRTYETI